MYHQQKENPVVYFYKLGSAQRVKIKHFMEILFFSPKDGCCQDYSANVLSQVNTAQPGSLKDGERVEQRPQLIVTGAPNLLLH